MQLIAVNGSEHNTLIRNLPQFKTPTKIHLQAIQAKPPNDPFQESFPWKVKKKWSYKNWPAVSFQK